MAPNGIICYIREDTVKMGRCRQPHPVVIWQLLLMLALVMTPIKTTTGTGTGQELMDLLKLEITFIAGWIYRQRGPPSLSLSVKDKSRGYFCLCWLAHKVVLDTGFD